MSGDIEDPMQCEAIRDDLPEMAFGTLSGRRRSELLSHVKSCLRCCAELEQLSTVADSLLQLAPQVEPPLRFELRLAQRLQTQATQTPATQATSIHRPRRFGLGALSVAAVATVILGFGLGTAVTAGGGNSTHPSATANLTTADLTSHGHVVGELLISRGSPAWVFMTISTVTAPGAVTCDVTLRGGKVETIGVFEVSGEYGAWGAPLRYSAGQVRSAQLLASNGTILASARVSA